LGGLPRTPDLEDVLEHSGELLIKRNAVIALGNIGSEEALSILCSYRKKSSNEFLDPYVDAAIDASSG